MFTFLVGAVLAVSNVNSTPARVENVPPATAVAKTTAPTAALHAKQLVKSGLSRSKTVWVTAYSSSPDETDDTPFTTASGKTVRDGIVATNLLPFGTKIQIPELFGNKVFVVEDRMHPRKTNVVDVWMPSKEDAIRFGAARTEIVIVNAKPEVVVLAK